MRFHASDSAMWTVARNGCHRVLVGAHLGARIHLGVSAVVGQGREGREDLAGIRDPWAVRSLPAEERHILLGRPMDREEACPSEEARHDQRAGRGGPLGQGREGCPSGQEADAVVCWARCSSVAGRQAGQEVAHRLHLGRAVPRRPGEREDLEAVGSSRQP